ncbi:flagellar basal body-associated protein FliL [Thalassotalea sp. LPB0316]|uniref:flagellar basal body-associated protein FliL n=1 Tax=Thalassotalea sp. LPB0316 TaxID=2769490 RepID=UPI001866FDF6|nr:flagellar basal body-associated protein FliL [Thalassotalea sp. LPB0316]QOL27095.1 flagellar basal body-associated protein FliL [Thalassotalea sp. LPB0316]
MADEEKELELEDGGKKKKLIIIIAVVVLLAAAGAGAFFFMGGEEAPSQAEVDAALASGEPAAVEAPAGATGSALYVPMPRPFRFNVPGASRDRYVEIRAQLLVRGAENEEEAKKHVPLIESTLLGVFSMANADDLSTSAGKTSLKQLSLTEVQKVMVEISGRKVVEQVLFTGFVMQ